MNGFHGAKMGASAVTGDMVTNALFVILNLHNEVACPHCTSGNVNLKFKHMGEFECRHCHYFWRTQ